MPVGVACLRHESPKSTEQSQLMVHNPSFLCRKSTRSPLDYVPTPAFLTVFSKSFGDLVLSFVSFNIETFASYSCLLVWYLANGGKIFCASCGCFGRQ